MTYPILRRRRPVAAAVLLFLLVFAVTAAQVRADGEDDPTFGTAGTVFAALGGGYSENGPFVRQAPSGEVYAAVGDDLDRRGRGVVVRVARFDASGRPLALAGADGVADLPVDFDVLVDFAILPGGDLLLAGTGHGSPGGRSGEPTVVLERFTADGAPVGASRQFFSGDDCVGNRQVAAVRIQSDGGVVVAWNGCSEVGEPEQVNPTRGDTPRDAGAAVVRYRGEDTSSAIVPDDVDHLTHLALGPNGTVFALGLLDSAQERGWSADTVTLRFRDDESGRLQHDAAYDDETLAGSPVDLVVDGTGRAVVWFDEQVVLRGGDPAAWTIARRQAGTGELDTGWGDGGVVELTDARIGPAQPLCKCRSWEVSSLTVQADGKVIALGLADYPWANRGEGQTWWHERTLVRFTAAGAVDESWADRGFKTLTLDQPADEADYAEFDDFGEPAVQGDGKLLVPFLSFRQGAAPARAPVPPERRAVGVSRIGLTPPEKPAPTPTPVATTPTPAAATAPSRAAAKPACKSRRQFAIRLRTGRRKAERSPIVSAVVRVDGKRVSVTRSARRSARVNLRNLPRGRFTVSISLRLKDGGTVRETRRYRTCTKKVQRELGPLRTRKPKGR